jgi:integrase
MTKGKKEGDRSELLTEEEMNRLINVVSGDLYFTTIYKLLRYTGRRIGEIYGTQRGKNYIGGLKLGDIDFSNNTIKTVILKKKKRNLKRKCNECGFERNVYGTKYCMKCGHQLESININNMRFEKPEETVITLRPDAIDILKVYVEQHRPAFKNKDYIFRDWSLVYLKKKIKQHVKQASINKNFSLHGFRTYFISNMIKNGITDNQIIKWTGHTNVSSLGNYNRLIPRDVEDKINKVNL